jgi:hypothetical protein
MEPAQLSVDWECRNEQESARLQSTVGRNAWSFHFSKTNLARLKNVQSIAYSVNGQPTDLVRSLADQECRNEREAALPQNTVESRASSFHFIKHNHVKLESVQFTEDSRNGLHLGLARNLAVQAHRND